MRYCLVLLVPVALAACSQAVPEADSTTEATTAGPGVSVTAAPGVAFDYRYAFRLPPRRIAAVQETHAAACERLGPARCRVTGLRYALTGRDSGVDGTLSFRLDPALARGFGRQAIAAVVAADGMMTGAEITGTDAGAAIRRLDRDAGDAAARRVEIDRRLAAGGLSAAERAELQRQHAALLAEARATRAARADQGDALATTPVTFTYRSGAAIRSFADDAPFTAALDLLARSAMVTLTTALTLLALLLPPALLAALLWLAWRALRPRLARARPAAPVGATAD